MRVIGYRIDHGLSQTGLARLLGMHQPAIARTPALIWTKHCISRATSKTPRSCSLA